MERVLTLVAAHLLTLNLDCRHLRRVVLLREDEKFDSCRILIEIIKILNL